MTYDIVIEKKISPALLRKNIAEIVGQMSSGKIIIMGNRPARPQTSSAKARRLQKLIRDTEKNGIRFETTEDFFNYLDA